MQAPLKASGWWNYKVPPMLAVAYFAIAAAAAPMHFNAIRWRIAIYLVAVVGIAGFGYVITDAFDIQEDRVLGKQNLWAPLTIGARIALISTLLAASWLPWLKLSPGAFGLGLIGLEFITFFLYAAPPVRLKERGLPGIVADAMYAHVLPALWTWIPFSRMTGARAATWFPFVLGAWALAVGMRHLLQHQAIQYESDKFADARTFAVRHGRAETVSLVVRRILPSEIIFFFAVLAAIGRTLPIVIVGFVLYLVWQIAKVRFLWIAKFNLLGVMEDADRSTVAGTLVMTRFYEQWLSLLILIGLVLRDPSYVVLLVLHLAVFSGPIVGGMADDLMLLVSFFRSLRATRVSVQVAGRSE
jgi:hypothetical protein